MWGRSGVKFHVLLDGRHLWHRVVYAGIGAGIAYANPQPDPYPNPNSNTVSYSGSHPNARSTNACAYTDHPGEPHHDAYRRD